MHSDTIRRAWVDLLSKSKHVKISLAVNAYTIAKFICTILCSAYTTLFQKITMPVITVRIKYYKVSMQTVNENTMNA